MRAQARAPKPSGGPLRVVQRQCACGAHTGGRTCEACQKRRRVQRQSFGPAPASNDVPSSVGETLSRPGRPLDASARRVMEPRFSRDLSQVRVHTDPGEARSALEVQAQAYTVGQHIVFAPGRYAPHTATGQELLAHELVHTVQQGPVPSHGELTLGDPGDASEHEAHAVAEGRSASSLRAVAPHLQRACLTAAECGKGQDKGSLENFVEDTKADPVNQGKEASRKANCKKPSDPKCTADGHGARAVQLEKLLKGYDATRLKAVTGLFVDKDIPDQYGAYTWDCGLFTPPIKGGGKCTFVPEGLEGEAKQFNDTPDATIGGLPRGDWRSQTLETLSHETGHARFDTGAKLKKPSAKACSFDSVQSELSELAAIMSGYETFFYLLQNTMLSGADKEKRLHDQFKGYITDPRESISGTLHKLRCQCECSDADAYIQKTVDFVTGPWSQEAKDRFHLEMHSSEWATSDLRWPIAAPPPKPAKPPTPPPSRKPPEPARPKFGPLYKPRTDFNREMQKSLEDL